MGVSLYKGSIKQNQPIITQSIGDRELDNMRGRNILIVDDLDDTRETLAFVLKYLKLKQNDFNIDVSVLLIKKRTKQLN